MKKVVLACFLLAVTAVPASAAPIGATTWDNTTLMIEYLGTSGANLYDFKYSLIIGAGGLQETDQDGHFDYLIGINVKPSEGNVVGASLTSTTAGSAWTLFNFDSQLNSGNNTNCGLQGGTGNDFFCAATTDAAPNPNYTKNVAPVTWTWNFTLNIAGVTDPNNFIQTGVTPIRALFADANGQTSLFSLAVPEPGSLSLLALGFVAVGLRKRFSRTA